MKLDAQVHVHVAKRDISDEQVRHIVENAIRRALHDIQYIELESVIVKY